jgi:hypothetical protein
VWETGTVSLSPLLCIYPAILKQILTKTKKKKVYNEERAFQNKFILIDEVKKKKN